jgi:general secretion pathway protein N
MMRQEAKPFRLRWPHYALAVLAYLACLLAWAPASLLAWALPRASEQVAWLDRTQGTVWRGGAAAFRLEPTPGSGESLGRMRWRLQPLDLLRGRLAYRLTLEGAGIEAAGTVDVAPRRVALRDLRAEASADWLGRLSPDLRAWQPQGRLLLESQAIAVEKSVVSGRGSLRWVDAMSGLVREPFGSYRAELEGKDAGLAISLSTESGALLLQGTGVWTLQQGLQFAGTARSAIGDGSGPVNVLGLLGPPRADGTRAIRIGR